MFCKETIQVFKYINCLLVNCGQKQYSSNLILLILNNMYSNRRNVLILLEKPVIVRKKIYFIMCQISKSICQMLVSVTSANVFSRQKKELFWESSLIQGIK